MTPPRETPITGEILPGHSRFTLYFKYTYVYDGNDEYSIEEIDIDADDIYQAHELGLEIFASDRYEPGGELMAEHTATRYPGEMYF